MDEIKPKKSLLEIINDLSELLEESHNFHEVIFNGEMTNLRISKPNMKKDDQFLI